jgi:hypothetical protein
MVETRRPIRYDGSPRVPSVQSLVDEIGDERRSSDSESIAGFPLLWAGFEMEETNASGQRQRESRSEARFFDFHPRTYFSANTNNKVAHL